MRCKLALSAGAVAGIALALAWGAGSTPAVARAPAPIPATVAGATGRQPLSLLAEPAAGIGPLVALIASARHSVDLVMYELRDESVERALADDARRGVQVRVILDDGYYGAGRGLNTPAERYLRSHGVHVSWAPRRYALTHEKALVVDDRTAAIMTLNLAGDYATTRDFAVIDRRPADLRAIVTVFDDDDADQPVRPPSAGGDLVWSPGAASTLVGAIENARHSIDVESEELAYRPAIRALCEAARRGIDVRLVMTFSRAWRTPAEDLRRCGAHVRWYHGESFYIHAKLLVIDSSRAIVGSQNLSTASLDYNRELSIDTTASGLVGGLRADFDSDYKRSSQFA